MKKPIVKWMGLVCALAVLPAWVSAQAAAKPSALKVAVVTFFSGSGAVVGGPSVNAAKLTIDQINKNGGIDGVPIKAQYVDESGGPTKNVSELRQLAHKVDVVLGYVSSADCLAVAPVAEQLKVPTIISDCTTNALFKGHHYRWIFRTQPPASANALAMALYILKEHPHIKSIAGLNQDYSFGHDQWKYFSAAMKALDPGVKARTALFTKLFSGSYTSQISRLQGVGPGLLYSSFWGGDLVAFIQQAQAQGLFQRTQVALSLGTQGGLQGLKALPNGVIVGSEHSYLMHPGKISNPRLAAFVNDYHKRFGKYPVSTYPYTLRRAVLALRDGYTKAIHDNGGKWPTKAQFVDALPGMTVKTLMGPMHIRKDHQASYHEMVGVSEHTSQYPFAVFNKVVTFPASMIMPPVGTKDVAHWISTLKPSLLSRVPAPKVYSH